MERLGFQEIKTINYYNHRDDICSKVYYNEILDTIVILDKTLEIPLVPNKNVGRTGVDASYLEHHFESVFFELYGEDIKLFLQEKLEARVLILVPTLALKNQWIKNLTITFSEKLVGDSIEQWQKF